MTAPETYWSRDPETLFADLATSRAGLASAEAARRLAKVGLNRLATRREARALHILIGQVKSPFVLILVGAALVSALVGEWTDAAVIFTIVLGSALLSGWRELDAQAAIEQLRGRLAARARAWRDGQVVEILAEQLVPGDVVELAAGSLIPADGVILASRDLYCNEAVLTGESFPAEKEPGSAPATAPLAERRGCLFLGTSVRSGTATMLVVQTGLATQFGAIAARLATRPPETEFERGLTRFGTLLTQLMLILVLVVFAANVLDEKPAVEALLFAVALAVGISPELLPAILSIALARGARAMAARGVIVRHLPAIENLGSMDVLCTDKTGTLTQGVMSLSEALDADGQPSPRTLELAFLNSHFQVGLPNPLDAAIEERARAAGLTAEGVHKVDEVPYDFVRKRLSVVVEAGGERTLITKGALEGVLGISTRSATPSGEEPLDGAKRTELLNRAAGWGEAGFRVLGVAVRSLPAGVKASREEERELCFVGFLLFFDPVKPGVAEALAALAARGVRVKIVSGDSRFVTRHVAAAVGMHETTVLTGRELAELSEEALWHRVETTDLFAEVDPNQKERIIRALRKNRHVVGYLGDGINDAPPLHAADVGISVEGAVDVARDAADLVLLYPDLDVLRLGIEEGRRTFANTTKYIFTTASANFGNMLSMAAASAFLPFLPLLAKQVLLNNFLSDFPAMAIAGDRVDEDWIAVPRRWDLKLIRDFMIVFGLVSSVFDILTFVLLARVLEATPELFRTGWFLESLATELAVALVVRTRLPMWRSRPSALLGWSSLAVGLLAIALLYLPLGGLFDLVPLPLSWLGLLLGITALYVATTEAVKHTFYRWRDARLVSARSLAA